MTLYTFCIQGTIKCYCDCDATQQWLHARGYTFQSGCVGVFVNGFGVE